MSLLHTHSSERAVVVQVVCTRTDPAEAADSLLELRRLSDTAGLVIVGQLTQNRNKPDGSTMIGSGKVKDLHTLVEETKANTVIFDNELNAFQAYNLHKALNIKVMDRTELILEIFSRRASSAEAKVQVELAQLQFKLSRIMLTEAQQRFKGGIGMRGPGEARLQLRNVPLRQRISELKKKISAIHKRQAIQGNQKNKWPVVSLVGYTNAGKSTLLNLLTDSDAYVDDRLFATLDTKTRLAWLAPTRQVLLTDTVGFIRNLPHGLVASFKSTLNVAQQADLLLIVVDAAYPRVADHIEVCLQTVAEIKADNVPCLLVLNKCDEGKAGNTVAHITEKYPLAIPVSAQTGYGIPLLKQAIIEELQRCSTLWQLPSATSET